MKINELSNQVQMGRENRSSKGKNKIELVKLKTQKAANLVNRNQNHFLRKKKSNQEQLTF